MAQEHFYSVQTQWQEGRTGMLSAPELPEKIQCATPPQFPKGVEGIWSPEHLYTAAIGSCFMATFLAIAENFKLAFTAFTADTVCKLELAEGKYLITEAEIKPVLTLQEGEDRDKAMRVLEKSKAACLITNSMKTTVTLNPIIQY